MSNIELTEVMPTSGSFKRIYVDANGFQHEDLFKFIGDTLYIHKPETLWEVYRVSVEEAKEIQRCQPLYLKIETEIEISLSDREYNNMIQHFVDKHMRPESIGMFNDYKHIDIKDALWKAVINDIANDAIQEVIENG